MKITIAILVLLLATITATVFTVKDSPQTEKSTGETQITLSTTEKEPATEILSVTESEIETYEIKTETVAPTIESKAETTTQKPATTKPITTTTQRATVPSTTQAPVATTKPVTTTVPTTTQPTTKAQTVDIDYYISLRHTYATRCIESGMPPKVLQHLMGHSDIKVTLDTYADVFDNFQSISVEKADSYLNQVGLAV